MKSLRFGLIVITVLLLGGGYFASQAAYFQGSAPDYAARIDQPTIAGLALAILVGAIALSVLHDKEEESNTK